MCGTEGVVDRLDLNFHRPVAFDPIRAFGMVISATKMVNGEKFLDTFRAPSVLLSLGGCFPFTGMFGSELRFQAVSLPSFYSMGFLLYIAVVLFSILRSIVTFMLKERRSFQMVLAALQTSVRIVYPGVVVIFYFCSGPRIAAIFAQVDALTRKPRKRVAEFVLPLLVLVVVAALNSTAVIIIDLKFLIPLSLTMSGIVVVFMALHLRIASFVRDIIEDLHVLQKELKEEALLQLREKYAQIWALTSEVNDVFGWPVLVTMMEAFCVSFTELYQLLTPGQQGIPQFPIVSSLALSAALVPFVVLIESSHHLCRKIGELECRLLALRTGYAESPGIREFSRAVKDLPVNISAAGVAREFCLAIDECKMQVKADKFMDTFRASSVLLFLGGCFPFTGIFRSELQFQLVSFPAFYSMGFLVYMTVVLISTLWKVLRFLFEARRSLEEVVTTLQFTVAITYAWVVIAFFLVSGPRIEKIFAKVDDIPRKPRKRLQEFTFPLAAALVVSPLHFAVEILIGWEYLIPLTLVMSGIAVVFMALLLRIASFLRDLIEDMHNPEGILNEDALAEMQERYVKIWALTADLTDVFGWAILLTLGEAFFISFSELYLLMQSALWGTPSSRILLSSLTVAAAPIPFFIIIECANHLLRISGELKCGLSALRSDHPDSPGIQEFVIVVRDVPLRISAAGFIRLHRPLFVSFVPFMIEIFANAMLTYMVILLQFGTSKETITTPSTPCASC
ncbi:unnamed protein product [Darwinula stevensoni]|uniref:Gustatory receptor n=1 Tax=Darwinula stevensoni TaxID=69355 RepID=A0A7R9AF92_9CRUS|nr:unnamed protein product [Darwinula stevensoni]CAG0902753.1 unnamed protein product [Darwinula stevensoni]